MRPVESIYQRLGKNMRMLREHAGITQAELGRLLTPPLGRPQMTHFENGRNRMQLHHIEQIAAIFDVSLDDLCE